MVKGEVYVTSQAMAEEEQHTRAHYVSRLGLTTMGKARALKEHLKQLLSAMPIVLKDLNSITEDGHSDHAMDDDRPENTATSMNIESSTQQRLTDSMYPADDAFGQLLPPMVRKGVKGGLASLPKETLHQNLQPVIQALENLNAELLLDLEQAQTGPQIAKGVHVKSVYDQVMPPISSDPHSNPDESCVRYLHISEVPDQYSIGIFVFAPYARIPLHDHPEMCVLSRVLYGDLQRFSLDLARENEEDPNMNTVMSDATPSHDSFGESSNRRRNPSSNWLGSWFHRSESSPKQKLPKGYKLAYKNHVDVLTAPAVTALYPYEGNLHEFVAGPHGAAVLDVLLPPYDNVQNRDCTFYEVHPTPTSQKPINGKEACYIVPTGQPENFHCISGQYRDLGVDESDL